MREGLPGETVVRRLLLDLPEDSFLLDAFRLVLELNLPLREAAAVDPFLEDPFRPEREVDFLFLLLPPPLSELRLLVVTGIIGRRPVHQQLRRFHLLKEHRLAELTADGGLLKAKGNPLGDEVEVRVVAEAHDVRGLRGQRRLTFLRPMAFLGHQLLLLTASMGAQKVDDVTEPLEGF
ncbi:hypothetical protein TYRP_017362 [Tyrophagus putrescentiae]|nr:hypothetical protein TYRP_017362 [Tyrophagus putrescentiae]